MFVFICDDDPIHAQHAHDTLLRLPACRDAVVRIFHSPYDLLEAVEEGGAPVDILVLDIEMPDMDGLMLAKRVNRANPACQIIFLTGYIHYAQDVYETEHVYFILKQEFQARIAAAVDKAMKRLSNLQRSIIRVQHGNKVTLLHSRDVLYLERSGRRIRVCLNQAEADLWTYQKPEELLAQVEANAFYQCHKSFFVNIRAIASWERTHFKLRSGTEIPISRANQCAAKEWFFSSMQLPF